MEDGVLQSLSSLLCCSRDSVDDTLLVGVKLAGCLLVPMCCRFQGIPPLDQVLEVLLFPMMSVAPDGLDFILFFPPHEVRRGSGVVRTVFFCFNVRGKE